MNQEIHFNYEIQIGETFDPTTNSKIPKQTLIITREQLAIIEIFADERKDADLNIIYKLNECEFRVGLLFTDTPKPL